MRKLSELVRSGEVLASKVAGDPGVAALTQSSTEAGPGAAFFAVAGHRADGHAFLKDVLARGVAAAVVEREDAFREHPNTIWVKSTRLQMALAASRWFDEPTRRFRLVGVTGTNGKTTTTFLLRHLWDRAGHKSGLVGTVHYAIGDEIVDSELTTPDPLSLQRLFHRMVEAEVSRGAMEVSSIALDQYRVAGTAFAVALFTNLTQDHLDYHGTMDRYYEAKKRLFDEYEVGTAVVNRDDPWGRRLADEIASSRVLTYSLDGEADFRVVEAELGKEGTRARVRTPAGELPLRLCLSGRHNLYNALGALAVAHALGEDPARAAQWLAEARGAPGRLERVETGGRGHVFVDYAHTDDALKNLLEAVRGIRGAGPGRIITVFGCGGDRDRTKRPRMARVASTLSDVTIATSDNPRTEDPDRILDDVEQGIVREGTEYHRVVNRREAIRFALSIASPEDLVVIAGKGHETYQILGTRKFPFDDRRVVREYFAQPPCTPGSDSSS